jgi:phosphoenolpyruvate carboxylase
VCCGVLCVLQGHKGELQQMYEDWPFFAATIDLIEMILAKADMRIAGLYDDVLVSDAAGKKLGNDLRQKFADTVRAICEVRRCSKAASRSCVWCVMSNPAYCSCKVSAHG